MNYITQEEAINKAYEAGWAEAASWAKRDDLIADIDSPAYLANRRAALAQPEPVEPAGDEKLWADFEEWWDSAGQYCRAGGGQYEKSFAQAAWAAAKGGAL